MATATKALATEDGQSAQTTQLQAISTAIGNIGLTNIGNLTNLTTTDKSSLVGAVNEVNAELVAKADKVVGATNGNLAALNASGNLTDSGENLESITTKCRIIYTAAANQTYGAQLAELYPYISALSEEKRLHTAIIRGDYGFTYRCYNAVSPCYTLILTDNDSAISITGIRLYASDRIRIGNAYISSSGTSVSNLINTNNTESLSLVFL